MAQVHAVQAEYNDWRSSLPEPHHDDPEVRDVRWMIEELQVSVRADADADADADAGVGVGEAHPPGDRRARRAGRLTRRVVG